MPTGIEFVSAVVPHACYTSQHQHYPPPSPPLLSQVLNKQEVAVTPQYVLTEVMVDAEQLVSSCYGVSRNPSCMDIQDEQ